MSGLQILLLEFRDSRRIHLYLACQIGCAQEGQIANFNNPIDVFQQFLFAHDLRFLNV